MYSWHGFSSSFMPLLEVCFRERYKVRIIIIKKNMTLIHTLIFCTHEYLALLWLLYLHTHTHTHTRTNTHRETHLATHTHTHTHTVILGWRYRANRTQPLTPELNH